MRRGIFAALVVVLLLPAPAPAAKKKRKAPTVTVMTQNLYLGADLGPAIDAGSICEAVDAGGQILNDVDASDFTERAALLAAQIRQTRPDLVGLQEAALWRFQADADFTASPATEVRYDFLQLLLQSLRKQNAPYRVVRVQEQFDQELPADRDRNDATQDLSLPLCGADEDGRLTMRDVILVRKKSKVKLARARGGQFTNRYSVKLAGTVPIDVERGWVSVEGRLRGRRFRFVNTHLEAFGDPSIREAQARELFAAGGPYRTRKPLIAVGDFNSGSAKDRVGPGFTVPGDEKAYNALVGDFGLIRVSRRQTCCYPSLVGAEIGGYRLDHSVDHVFVKPRIKLVRASLTGTDPTVTSASGLLASDHAGVVSRLRLR